MLRVLHLTLSFAPGGRAQAIRSLSEGLRYQGAECHLWSLRQPGPSASDLAASAGGVLNYRSIRDWQAVRRLHRYCRDARIDLLHVHDAASQLVGVWTRLLQPRLRLLMTFHRSLSIESARWRDRLRNRLTTARSHAIVTGSHERRQHYLQVNRVPPGKLAVIPFGVDLSCFRPDPEASAAIRQELGILPGTVLIGAIGHFGPEKGTDVVVRAFQELCARYDERPVVLAVLGDGTTEQRAKIRALAGALPPGQVRLVGHRSDPQRWLAAFDVLMHAPRQEAFGLVLIEAMATGVPVVATRVGGVPEIVRDGQTGFLVPPEAPQSLAAALQQLCEQPELSRALGSRGREVALREYSLEVYARRHLDLYDRLLAGRAPNNGVGRTATPAGTATIFEEARSLSWVSR